MKKIVSLLLAAILLAGSFAVPAYAEDDPSTESSTPAPSTENPDPPEDPDPKDPPETDDDADTNNPPQGSTPSEPSDPKPCTHVFGDWIADEAAHGRKCTLCGHAESNAHSWAAEIITVDPTCGEAGGKCKVCTVCAGVLVTELIEPTGKHTYDNSCDTKCNVCGAERTVEHTFGTGWTYSGKGHWHKCTVCGAAGEVKDHYPGPAATEEKDQICLTCGYIMMKKKPHTHKWDTKWTSNAENHWYTCTVCQEKDKTASHSYDDGCDTDCNVCGYVRTAAHTYDISWEQTELTHCNVCTVCGEAGVEEAHIADSTGTKCSVCGYAMEATEQTHEHTFADDAWEFDDAGHWQECDCGEKTEEASHQWDAGKKEKKVIRYTCEICQAEKEEEVPKAAFPWLLVASGGGILICLVGIVICVVMIIRNRKYDD